MITTRELINLLSGLPDDAELRFETHDYVAGWPRWKDATVRDELDADDAPTGLIIITLHDVTED